MEMDEADMEALAQMSLADWVMLSPAILVLVVTALVLASLLLNGAMQIVAALT